MKLLRESHMKSARFMVIQEIKTTEQAKTIREFHQYLSSQFGVQVGFCSDRQAFTQLCKIEGTDQKIRDVIHLTALEKLPQSLDSKMVPARHRQTLLSFLMAKDDNMILLMTGLLRQIQKNHALWSDEAASKVLVSDLFGLQNFDRDWANSEEGPMKQLYKNDSPVSVIGNLLKILEMNPQYFRSYTLLHCLSVLDHFYSIDQRLSLTKVPL